MATKKPKRLLTIGLKSLGILLLLGAAFLLLVIFSGFSESVTCHRGTWNFFVGISEPVIRDFPTASATTEVEYGWGCGDGPKAPEQSVSYNSKLPASELLSIATQHILQNGYVSAPKDSDYPDLMVFTRSSYKRSYKLYLAVSAKNDGTSSLGAQVNFYDR